MEPIVFIILQNIFCSMSELKTGKYHLKIACERKYLLDYNLCAYFCAERKLFVSLLFCKREQILRLKDQMEVTLTKEHEKQKINADPSSLYLALA